MTKTEACRRVALAALVAGTMTGAVAVTHDAHAKITINGMSLNGFADDGTLPTGVSPNGANRDGVQIAARAKPTPDPDPKRGSSPKGGSRGRG